MTVGGWFDAENLYGALNTYKTVEKLNPGITNTLVMGPWFHGGWARSEGDLLGDIRFGAKTSVYYRESVELPFFNCLLKDKCSSKQPEALVFETGSNQWRSYDQWPPINAGQKSLYLQPNGGLAWLPPAATGREAFDEYVSDPSKPVPFINGIEIGMTREYMVEDQRFAARRPDVLVYQTDPVLNPVTMAGPLTATLYVASTGTDADYIVKLIDVFPNDTPDNDPNPANVKMGGYQMMVRGEPMRARFRNSYEKPEPLVPNKISKVEFTLPDINHTFMRGHRIMVQIQSSWFPLVDRNPQRFVNINKAIEEDFQKATQRIYRSSPYNTQLTVNVLK
jgi:putative CocE/NonD family hydrolase